MKLFKNKIFHAVIQFISKMSSHESYLGIGNSKSIKFTHPAAERNKEPILQCLQQYINPSKKSYFLEIASGSGQHVSYFAPHFPNTSFQPTEIEKVNLKSINEYICDSTTGNILDAQFLDVREPPNMWIGGILPPGTVDYMLCVNLIHISEWACTEGLFTGAGTLLKPGGILFTYGPYAFNGVLTPQSNVDFNASLRARNPSWGVRDVTRELQPLAQKHGMSLYETHHLPANNKMLIWRKDGE